MRLFDLGLNRLIEESGDLLKRFILRRLLSARAFYRQAMDLGGQCLQLSFFHNYLRWCINGAYGGRPDFCDNVWILHEKTGREKNASRHSKSFVQGFGM
jgi:hypothetical protein